MSQTQRAHWGLDPQARNIGGTLSAAVDRGADLALTDAVAVADVQGNLASDLSLQCSKCERRCNAFAKEILSRLPFAFTIGFHIIFPPMPWGAAAAGY